MKLKNCSLIFILCQVFFGSLVVHAGIKAIPPGTNENSAPVNIMFVLDTSSSMNDEVSAGQSRLDVMLNSIQSLVEDRELSEYVNYGLITWATDVDTRVELSSQGASSISNLISNGGIVASGGTRLDRAMPHVTNYLKPYGTPGSPITVPCQKTIVIVMSDGAWEYHVDTVNISPDAYDGQYYWYSRVTNPTAIQYVPLSYDDIYGQTTRLLNRSGNLSIKTFAVGIYLDSIETDFSADGDYSSAERLIVGNISDAYNRLAVSGGTGDPIYPTNGDEILNALKRIIFEEVDSSFEFVPDESAYQFDPSDTELAAGYRYFLKAPFQFKSTSQWQGRLQLARASRTGNSQDEVVWDAGDLLDARSSTDRQIWSIFDESSGLDEFIAPSGTLSDAFVEKFTLDSSALPSEQSVRKIIDFVRGVDVFDEDEDASVNDERWKLADIYHSAPRIHDNRIYVGSNGGMLHSFDLNSGVENWAFVPPNLLATLKDMESSTANQSSSIYGVDGTPSIREISYLDSADNTVTKTILMVGLGRGGKGYFALDITDKDAPEFMFAFQNMGANTVRFWDAAGDMTEYATSEWADSDNDKMDYRKLGEAWSTPQITQLPVQVADGELPRQEWVAIFGAGYASDSVNDAEIKEGQGVYVVRLEGDKAGERRALIELNDTRNNQISSRVPGDVALVTPDRSAQATYRGAMAYVGDLDGQVWKINLTDQVVPEEVDSNSTELNPIWYVDSDNNTASLLTVDSDADEDRRIFQTLVPIFDSSKRLWLYGGTGDIEGEIRQLNSSIENIVFAVKDLDFPSFDHDAALTRSDLVHVQSESSCQANVPNGWYARLPGLDGLLSLPQGGELVTGVIDIAASVVGVPTYIPSAANSCSAGQGYIRTYRAYCGAEASDPILITDGIPVSGEIKTPDLNERPGQEAYLTDEKRVIRGRILHYREIPISRQKSE